MSQAFLPQANPLQLRPFREEVVSSMRRWLSVLVVLIASGANGAALDDEFLAAREAYRSGSLAKLEQLARKFKGQLLEPYLAYWQFSLKLEQTPPDELRAFIQAQRESPLSERLRAEWLKSLGKRGQWELFDAELPSYLG